MSRAGPTRENTCAVIVTYFPDSAFPARLQEVLAQFPAAVIIDNGSAAAHAAMLQELAGLPGVTLHANAFNLGIAAALNQGAEFALHHGFEWIVTLDQDTQVAPDMLATLLEVFAECGGGKVIVGSNYWDAHKHRTNVRCGSPGRGFLERKTLITSGTLLSVSSIREVGRFREDYFIDSVDHEFCLRARARGYRILISCRPLMRQAIGSEMEQQWWTRFMSFDHAPVRKYFIARNTIATAMHYFSREPLWSMRQGWRLLLDLASIILCESNKLRKTQAFMTGLAHGLTGKLGPIEKTWPHGAR